MPKRKLAVEMESYLKEVTGLDHKKVAVFLSVFGMPGTTLQKISSIVHTKNADLVSAKAFTYLLNFSEAQLKEAEQFAVEAVGKNE